MAFFGMIPEGAGGHVVEYEAQVNLATPHDSESLDIRLLGLPQIALRQGIPRWQSALKNCDLEYPKYEVTINLAPADLPKPGTTLEAPIAAILGILGQTSDEPEKIEKKDLTEEEIRKILWEIKDRNIKRKKLYKSVLESDWIIIGELSLYGELKSTRSLLGMISNTPKEANIIVPFESKDEASLLLFNAPQSKNLLCKDIKRNCSFYFR